MVDHSGSTLVIAPSGEIDIATVGLVREAVEREHKDHERLVVDLRRVMFMDTSGLRYVLELSERAAQRGFEFRIVRGGRAVQRVFEVSGLDGRLPFVDEPGGDPERR